MLAPGELLRELRREMRLTQQEMADLLGVKQPSYAYLEKKGVGIDHLRILSTQHKVNPLYLLNGQMPMFIDKSYNADIDGFAGEVAESSNNYETKGTIMVPIRAYASYVGDWDQDSQDLPLVVIPGMKDRAGRVFEVNGNSMEPMLLHGDYIGCTRVKDPKEIRDGLIYVVVSRSQGITIKYLRLTLHSLRCMSANTLEHPAFDLELDEVREIWEVNIRITRHIHSVQMDGIQQVDQKRVTNLERIVEHLLELPGNNIDPK